ncbi:RluA family pseudouridine synthase [Calidifontimicrobium sp. SYSU G02091]|uniref:RluA family pseudouridine synthase n=1 Tax=Calidifontimicrobium sp. SYSU G02091 TaxID=2926421 RepID=UPI001F52D22B|nr:RluA family pseudouridine synthase [Calidifontimicrobium sp. SYSU G02091]MCI1193687.1 RluA family pseudouridine synthase [Calidifontimicrobium sp. SYSU G02091]
MARSIETPRQSHGDEPDWDDDEAGDAAGGGEGAVELRERAVDAALHGLRLDKALVALAPEFSRSHLQGLIERGHVRVDGEVATVASRTVRAGQRLAVELVPTAQARAFRPQPMALVVVHEDDDVLVIDKPAGLVVHPAPGNWSGTLVNGLLARDAGAAALPRAGIVHRLDKDTSGLMVVARTLPAMTALVRAIAAREVRREYQALAHGDVGAAPFTVDAPIGRDPRVRVRMAVVAHGKPARTDVTPVAHARGVSAVWCRLHTGRTHQIRVHLAHRGHPLVADALYGGAPALGVARQALHAARLGFAHPVSGAWLQFERPLPADLARAWQQVVGAAPAATMRSGSE